MQVQRQQTGRVGTGQPRIGFEHVVMEGVADPRAGGPPSGDGTVLATHYVDSPFHGYTTELSVLAGHYLRVRYSHADGAAGDYVFDLGFLGPDPVRVRRFPWAGFALVLGLLSAGAGAMALAWARQETWSHPFLAGLAGLLTLLLGIFAAIRFLRRTTESLELRSLHGHAPLARLTGGLGSTRQLSALACDLAKGARHARAERPRARREFLCDELRAHYALHQAGAITTVEYEDSKARILAAHD